MPRILFALLLSAAFLVPPLRAVTFESGDFSMNLSGYIGLEADYATMRYTPVNHTYYFGPGYSSLNFDFWMGTRLHTRFSLGVRPLFPNLYGASNLAWIPGVEAYGEWVPNGWFKVRMGQLITPLGYFMPIHLNPALYPMVGPPSFFDEETLPYNTALEATFTIKPATWLKIPLVVFGGKPLTRTYARTMQGDEPDLNTYYSFGTRFSAEIAKVFTAGGSFYWSEGMASRVYNGFFSFQNDLFYLVGEMVSRTWGDVKKNNAAETSYSVVAGVHVDKITPYLTCEMLHVETQKRDYRVFGAGFDWDLAENFKLKLQGDYRPVSYSGTNWSPDPVTIRSSFLFYFK